VTAITASVLLIATDAITGGSHWAHHPGISATPLLLIAAAIAAASLVQPPHQRRRLLPLIAALAFTAWGLAQLLPNSTAAGYLNDTAILLFVTDAAYAVAANARNAPHSSRAGRRRHGGRSAVEGAVRSAAASVRARGWSSMRGKMRALLPRSRRKISVMPPPSRIIQKLTRR
jgi:hypothetical protein